MTDLLGRKFEVGQLVAYGGRAGSHGYMAVGRVSKVNGDKVSVKPVASNAGSNASWSEPEDKSVALRLPNRAVILSTDYQTPPPCDCRETNVHSYGWYHKQGCAWRG